MTMLEKVEAALKASTGLTNRDGTTRVKYATVKDIARIAGCTKTTARKHLNNMVIAETALRERIHTRELGNHDLYYFLNN